MSISTNNQTRKKQNVLIDSSDGVDVADFFEYDDIKRTADLSIYSSNLQSVQASSVSASVALSLFDAFKHWGVIVEFKAGPIFTFDGDTKGGFFNGRFVVWVKRGRPNKDIIESIKPIDSVHCTPSELIMRARKSAENHTNYNILFSNCQTWASQFCKDLSADAEKKLPWNSSDLAVTGLATAAVGGLLAWGVSNLLEHRRENARRENTYSYPDSDSDSDDS